MKKFIPLLLILMAGGLINSESSTHTKSEAPGQTPEQYLLNKEVLRCSSTMAYLYLPE